MKKISLSILTVAVLSACQSPATKTTLEVYKNNEDLVNQQREKINNVQVGSTYQHMSGIYLGAKSMPLRNDIFLPEAFYQIKVFSASGSLSLPQAISEISAKSGISIRIANDVMQPQQKEASSTAVPIIGLHNISLNATTSTKAILDQLTSDAGLSWEFNSATGVATVQRTITRSFTIKSALGDTTITSTTGAQSNNQNQGAAGGISSSFSSNVNVTNISKINPLQSINDAVKSVLTKSGTSITTATNSIIITDTADAIERAARIIEREDEILSRNANIRVQIFSFTSNEADSAGLNISALYKDLNKYGFNFASPTSVVTTGAAQFSSNVLSGNGKTGHTDGSTALFNLLAQRGRVAVVHDINVPISNLSLYALSLPRQIKFLSSTTPSPGTIAGQTPGTPGLTTEAVTFGFKMALLGNILDSNTIKLKFNIGNLDMQLRTIDSGTGVNLQSPDLSGFELPADVTVKPNQTILLTSIDHNTNTYTRSGLSQDTPLVIGGGSYNAGTTKEKYYILITPTMDGNTQ